MQNMIAQEYAKPPSPTNLGRTYPVPLPREQDFKSPQKRCVQASYVNSDATCASYRFLFTEVSLNSPTHCRSANRRRPNINHPEISAAIPNTSRDVPAHPANTSRAETQCSDLSYGNKVIAPNGTEWTGGAVGDIPAGRRAQQNILRELPGPSGLARQGIDEDKLSSAWLLIIDDRILKHIEKCTEQEPRRCQEVDDWSVSLQELKAFIAILYARGATGAKGLELESLWSKKWGLPFAGKTMARNRFREIMRYS
ncbi:Transposase IS4 [Popillia japonica]|uniref:Transposase IS4 n=1 Tax=Popillia japonica TaxID=7064 RepID=A0AAW1JES4_POPJA